MSVRRRRARPGSTWRSWRPGHGPVALVHLTLFDRPASPLTLEVLLNPLSEDGRGLIEGLASQPTLAVLFYDRVTGDAIGRRVLPVAPSFRAAPQAILEHVGEGPNTTPERWRRAVATVRAHLR